MNKAFPNLATAYHNFSFILISRSEVYIDKGTSQFVVGSIHNTPNIFHFVIAFAPQLHGGTDDGDD